MKSAMQQNQIAVKFPTTFYALFFIISAAVTDASIFGNRNHIRFRRPDDIWEPPFRTVLCENYPIRIQINADPDKVCRGQCALLIQLAFLEMFGKSPFGSSNTSAFGAGSSLFGSSANRPATAFGTQVTTQSTGLFGQKSIFGSPGQSTSLFGSTQPASSTYVRMRMHVYMCIGVRVCLSVEGEVEEVDKEGRRLSDNEL
ncbi:Nuclear pore complex protein [Dirofilaria immitis]